AARKNARTTSSGSSVPWCASRKIGIAELGSMLTVPLHRCGCIGETTDSGTQLRSASATRTSLTARAAAAAADGRQVGLQVIQLGVGDLSLVIARHATPPFANSAQRIRSAAALEAEVARCVADRAVARLAALGEVDRR